jgi:hypothetical protein
MKRIEHTMPQTQTEQHKARHDRRRATAALAAVGLLAFGAVEYAAHHHENKEDSIIKDYHKIPKGHELELPADGGKGPIQLGQEYGAPGHIEDLQRELTAEEPTEGPDAHTVPAGSYPVYDGFVKPELRDQLHQEE